MKPGILVLVLSSVLALPNSDYEDGYDLAVDAVQIEKAASGMVSVIDEPDMSLIARPVDKADEVEKTKVTSRRCRRRPVARLAKGVFRNAKGIIAKRPVRALLRRIVH